MSETLLAVIIGGLITLAATFITNRQAARSAMIAELKKEKREKLQRISLLTAAIEKWVLDAGHRLADDPSEKPDGNPSPEIKVLTALYFPELSKQSALMCDASGAILFNRMETGLNKRSELPISHEKQTEYFQKYGAFLKERETFIKQLEQTAHDLYRGA